MWRGYPVEGFFDTRWLTGLWSTHTQVKVEGIVLRAAWHWVSGGSVINNPLGEPGHTPIVGLPSAWGSVDGDHMFTPILWEGSSTGDPERYSK